VERTVVVQVQEADTTSADTDEIEAAEAAYGYLDPVLAEFATLGPDDPRRRRVREELAVGFLPIVHHIARRYQGRGEPVADLEQVGVIGLLHALERFDPERGSHFLSFAVPTITGEIQRHFRDRTWSMKVPRTLKDLQNPIRDAVPALSTALGRAPKPSEIAAHLGVATADVVEALNAAAAYTADSLDRPVGSTELALSAAVGRCDAALERVEHNATLRAALHTLPRRDQQIVVLRFFGDLTQTQIAARVGLSQMHVSRVLSRALSRLRQQLSAENPDHHTRGRPGEQNGSVAGL
jgi:RNA polymerase sigma-B factor